MSEKYPPITSSPQVRMTPKSGKEKQCPGSELPSSLDFKLNAEVEMNTRNPRGRMDMLPYRQRVGLGPSPLDSLLLTPRSRPLEDGTNNARLKGIEMTLNTMREVLGRMEERMSGESENILVVVEKAVSNASMDQEAVLNAIKRIEERLGCIENFQRSVLFSVFVQDQADLECMMYLSEKFSDVVKMMEKLENGTDVRGSDEDLVNGDAEAANDA